MGTSPEEMAQTMLSNLEAKTGRTLEAWLELVLEAGISRHGEIVRHLKADYGVTHGYANLIAHKALESRSAAPSGDALIEAQYQGEKAALRPIYDALVAAVRAFGDDVDISPKKAYVSLRRNKQFALVQPSTRARVDLGVNLKGTEPVGRLEASGSFNAMVSHRVRLGSKADVDEDVLGWLRQAYELA